MNKQYVKPMLYAESFELAEHITACAHLNSATADSPQGGCGWRLNGPGSEAPILFITDVTGSHCTDNGDLEIVDLNNGGGTLCYNYFMDEGQTLFQS